MFLIGESLNVISKKIGAAYKARDPKPIQEEALFQREKGMDYIDINLGPAKKEGHELMPWVVKTVQEVVPDVPLALDTSNIDAIAAALKVYKPTAKPPLVNSIMVRPERYEKMVPIAKDHNADFIALMWGPEGLPRDENERAALCVELVYFANEAGIPNEKIWIDGIVTPVNIQQPQLISLMNFQAMIQEIAPGAKSTCGLSNISNGPPGHLRPILNQTYMVMLQTAWHVLGHRRSVGHAAGRDRQGQAPGHRRSDLRGDGRKPAEHGLPLQGNAGLRQDGQRHPRQHPVLGFLAGTLARELSEIGKPSPVFFRGGLLL